MNRFTTKRTPRTSSKLGLTILPLAVLSTLALVSSDTAQAALNVHVFEGEGIFRADQGG